MPRTRTADRTLRWGEGRIKERPRRDRDSQWQALWLERQPDGSYKERAKTFPTRDAAEDHLRDVQRAKRDGRYAAPDNLTVDAMMADFLARGAPDWEPSTRASYRLRYEGTSSRSLGRSASRPSRRPPCSDGSTA
jgi:hypothetical protein